jgi:hypothetical protein
MSAVDLRRCGFASPLLHAAAAVAIDGFSWRACCREHAEEAQEACLCMLKSLKFDQFHGTFKRLS